MTDAHPGKTDGRRLTTRELQVLGWVPIGKTNADTAKILGTSPRTIQKHLEHIFEKLGVENRTAAAAWTFKVDAHAPRLSAARSVSRTAFLRPTRPVKFPAR